MVAENSDPETLAAKGEELLSNRRFEEALARFDAGLAEHPDDPGLLNFRGRTLNNLGRLEEAAEMFERAIQLSPNHAVAHNNLGHVMRAMGNIDRAESAFLKATVADPEFARAHYNLATVYSTRQLYEKAAECIYRGLELDPAYVPGYINLGELLQFLNRYEEALEIYRRGLQIDDSHTELHVALGQLQHSLGEIEAAMQPYRRALELEPDNAIALAGCALLEEIIGNVDAGWSLIGPRITDGTDDPDLLHAAGRLLRRKKRHEDALALLLPLRDRTETDWSNNPTLYFSIGEICDELGRYDEAFEHFSRANELRPTDYDPDQQTKYVTRLIEYFSETKLRSLPRAERSDARPVFIIGMPRSGTSLTEQILASHPQVYAGGERKELPLLLDQLGKLLNTTQSYPECLDLYSARDAAEHRDAYLRGFAGIPHDASCFTDKRPWNFLHLGLIGVLFPGARIVHCSRDPRDTALSIYFQNLNARTEPYAADLEHIAAYISDYKRIMEHWHAFSDLPIFEMKYESLVEDQEKVTRELLEFLDLGWAPECLRFYESERLMNTASYAQVREPIYKSSVGRYKNYASYLGNVSHQLVGADQTNAGK